MRHSVGPGKQHIGDGSCQPAISVIKRMDGHEPQVGHRCFQDRIDIVHIVDPIQEQRHFLGNICRCRGFVVNLLLSECPGDNLHRFFSNSPTCHCYRMDTAAACGKQSGVPIEQTLLAQLIGVITDGIDHYLNNPLRVVIRFGKTFGGDPEMPRHRRTDPVCIQQNPFYLVGSDDVFSHNVQGCLGLNIESETAHHSGDASFQ